MIYVKLIKIRPFGNLFKFIYTNLFIQIFY